MDSSLGVLEQVLLGFERDKEGYDLTRSLVLPSEKLRQMHGFDAQAQLKMDRVTNSEIAKTAALNSWQKHNASQTTPRAPPSRQGTSHGHSSIMDDLYRGGEFEEGRGGGKKTVARPKDQQANDLFRGETVLGGSQVGKKKVASAMVKERTNPWNDTTTDDVMLQRAAEKRATTTAQQGGRSSRREPAKGLIFGSDDASSSTQLRRKQVDTKHLPSYQNTTSPLEYSKPYKG